MNGNGKWFTTIVAPLIVAGLIGIAAWAWSLQSVNSAQDVRLGQHDIKHAAQEKQADRMEGKIDRLLELMHGAP